MPFKKITCTGNYRKPQFFKIVNMVANYFSGIYASNSKFQLMLTNEFQNDPNHNPELDRMVKIDNFDNCVSNSDFILSIGGDGTILSTVRKLKGKEIPVLGVHIGNLGFLAQSTEDTLIDALECLNKGDYELDNRILLKITISNLDKIYYAFNDVVVDHGSSGRILKTKVYSDGVHINNYEGDGVIISTPTGSTGYSLSSGGPIIYPNLDVVTITPISSHSLSARPIVISSNSNIEIKFPKDFIDAALTVDGQERVTLTQNNIISINKANFGARLVLLPFYNYMSTLKEKLHWSGNSK
tara:strand:+ start:324 stop:1217 length:894 start_codon:yes stop_codon:yes gene_type:complete